MDEIKVGDRVRTGVYLLGEWKPMLLGDVVAISSDGTLCQVDTMSLHGGSPRKQVELISHVRREQRHSGESCT